MCFHSRLIHGCGHYQWGGAVSRCSTERRFDEGELDEGCSAMWSHGFRTISTVAQCPKCVKAKAKTDDKLAAIKAKLQALKTTIGAHPTKKGEGEVHAPAESDPVAVASSYPTPEGDGCMEDDEDDEVNEVIEEIKYLHSEVSYDEVPEQPVPEQPPKHPDPEHRPPEAGSPWYFGERPSDQPIHQMGKTLDLGLGKFPVSGTQRLGDSAMSVDPKPPSTILAPAPQLSLRPPSLY